MRAGKVLIDLKTGGFSPSHLDDLRFYALVETIKLGVPPRRVATHYLDTGKLVPEDVTEATLAAAARRVARRCPAMARAARTRSDAGASNQVPRAAGVPCCPRARQERRTLAMDT